MEAIILAGGLGTRLRNAVSDVPKPMAPVGNVPFLAHLLSYWISQGVTHAIMSVGYKADVIRDYFGECYEGITVEYAIEEKPLGTGGGLLLAAERLRGSEPVLVVNGDTFCEVNLAEMVRFHQERLAELTIALLERQQGLRYHAVQMSQESRIIGFGARRPDMASCLINGGVYIFDPTCIRTGRWQRGKVLSLEGDLFQVLLVEGSRMYGFVTQGRFIDIGVPEDYYAAGIILRDGTLKRDGGNG